MQNNYVNIVVKNKYTFIIIIFLSLILLVEFTLNNALVTEYNQDPKITNHYLNDFSMTETNKSGALNWSLKGERLEKYPKSERSEVFSPNMRIYSIGPLTTPCLTSFCLFFMCFFCTSALEPPK